MKTVLRNSGLERFRFSRKRGNAPTLCFDAIPDGKPLHTFPGIALTLAAILSLSLLSPGSAAETKKPLQPGQTLQSTTKGSGTSEFKWKPTGEPWVKCERNGMQCRCSGHVVDCRAATGTKKTVKTQ